MNKIDRVCPNCKSANLDILSETSGGVSYKCNECGVMSAEVKCNISIGADVKKIVVTSGERVRNKPIKQIQFKKGNMDGSMVIIISRTEGKTDVIQIARTSSGEIRHLDCKRCNIVWGITDVNKFDDYFEVTEKTIKCKTCNGEVSYS